MDKSAGLTFDVLGDYSTFSRAGKGIGYRIRAGGAEFLLDCGAPVFHQLGKKGMRDLDGIIITHSHEDHKRWLTEIGLFNKYRALNLSPFPLYGIEEVLEEIKTTAAYPLEQSLSEDSRNIVNISYEEFFENNKLGPEARFWPVKIKNKGWRVVDEKENILPPDRAKVFPHPGNRPPRFLFKDPEEKIWVEPASFYDYTDDRFYRNTDSLGLELESGLSITPVKATFWHGLPGSSYLFSYENEHVLFTSDTHYDPQLWKKLAERKNSAQDPLEDSVAGKFEVSDDINKYIQQTWSEKRLQRALSFYNGDYPIVHDVTSSRGVVHTPYKSLEDFNGELLLTHSPDTFTALDPICAPGQSYLVKNNKFFIVAADKTFQTPGDCFSRENERFYIGRNNQSGSHLLVKTEGGDYQILHEDEAIPDDVEKICEIKLYEQIKGDYYPVPEDPRQNYYIDEEDKVIRAGEDYPVFNGEIAAGKRDKIVDESNFLSTEN